MKKTLRMMGFCALAALAIVSCKKNEEKAATTSFSATITQPNTDAKTHIGADNWLMWNSGDAIKVFAADGTPATFTTTDNNQKVANFEGEIEASDRYCAFYPAAGTSDATSGTVTLTLAATQTYANGSFSTNTYPMAAVNSGTSFTFSSPCGLLVIPVKGTGTLGSIELTGKNGENLAGTYTYTLSDLSYTFAGNATMVTLDCGSGLTLDADNAATMVFVLPVGTLTAGFTAVLKGTNGTELYRLETTNDNAIEADMIRAMAAVTVQAIAVTTDANPTVGYTDATIGGSYVAPTGMSVTEVGFYWGESATAMTQVPATLANPFSLNRTGLTEGTPYYFQAYAKNGENEYTGTVETFTTGVSFTAPTVTTGTAEATSATSATGHVTLTIAGTGPVTQIGLCWGTEENPTISPTTANFAAANGHEVGTEYTVDIEGLEEETTYYVRGYAKVGNDYYYDVTNVSFTTPAAIIIPGAISAFTINANGDQVYFSQGNLQYTKSTNEWSFMQHQYDIVETQNVGQNYANQDVVSLFGWGTSGYNHGATAYQPWSTSSRSSDYYAYGNMENNLYDGNGQADWGYNAISNGGNTENSGWRTLTPPEWNYVFNTRSTASGIRWAKGMVNGVKGTILLPDNWTPSVYALNSTNGGNYDSNTITVSDWTSTLEPNGAVFLPAAGCRWGTGVYNVGSDGYYYSSSCYYGNAYFVDFSNGSLNAGSTSFSRDSGLSVRLVRNAE